LRTSSLLHSLLSVIDLSVVISSIDLSHVQPERKRASVESSLFSNQGYRIAKMGLGARFLQRVVKNEAMKK
jgi:hypothetical protein